MGYRRNLNKKTWLDPRSVLPLFFSAIITLIVVTIFFSQTQGILELRLKQRLIAVSSTAALQFDSDRVEKLVDNTDVESKDLAFVISQMKKIRDVNPDIRYIYIWAKTGNENILKFIADAEMIEPIDENKNGTIDEDELPPLPGEEYDISETPEVNFAFNQTTTTEEFIVDKWGTFSSSWAPIKDSSGETVAVLGIDVEIDNFYKVVSAMLIPFILLASLLLLILTMQTVYLIRIWNSRLEIMKELDSQKDELLGLVSHQLATPVSSMKWYLEMMRDGDLGELTKEQKEHVSAMHGIGENMSDLVSMILDVSRIQLGRMRIDKQDLDLNVFFHDLMAIIEPKSDEKKVKFIKIIPDPLPSAKLDRRYTNMTIENLLSNAIKYTPEGGTVKCEVTIENGWMQVKVADTGMGIPKAEQDKIFGRMFRASNARNAIDGNGFGLFVAKGAVEAQGGKIWFESEEGKGTTFYVRLPLKD